MKLFSLNEIQKTEPKCTDKAQMLCDKHLVMHEFKIESLKALTGRPPEENEIYFMWTINSFNSFTFIPYIIKNVGIIQELTITTYSINRRIIDALLRYLDAEKILNVSLLVSDSLRYRLPKVCDYLHSLVSNRPRIFVSYGWNHSKIALARTDAGHYILEGSGNFSENAQFEQYVMLNSQRIYEFRKQCISEIVG